MNRDHPAEVLDAAFVRVVADQKQPRAVVRVSDRAVIRIADVDRATGTRIHLHEIKSAAIGSPPEQHVAAREIRNRDIVDDQVVGAFVADGDRWRALGGHAAGPAQGVGIDDRIAAGRKQRPESPGPDRRR